MNPVVIGIAAVLAVVAMAGMGGSAEQAQPQPQPRRGPPGPTRSSPGGGGRPGTGPTRLPPGRPGKWYEWHEFVRTSKSHLDNTPSPQAASSIILLVANVMDPLRELLRRPVQITSAYRSPAVNAATAGSATDSDHMRGEAVDFKVPAYQAEDGTVVPAMRAEEVARFILASGLPFDQLIWYMPGRGGHVHVGWSATGPARRDLRWAPEGSDREVPWYPNA